MNAKKTRRERKNAKVNKPQNPQNKEGQQEILTKEQQQKIEAEKLQQELQNKLNEIHEFIGDRNYIFRGENKKNEKISSALYRYFQPMVAQAVLEERSATSGIDKQTLEKRFGKSIIQEADYGLKVEETQKDLILSDVQEYVDFEDEIHTLTELQHYGGLTNLIDFSYDLAIALFFACDGEPDKDGRLILLRTDADDILPARKNQNNRSVFQKSVFVRREVGYIVEVDGEKIKEFEIPQKLKKLILDYVQNYFGIRTETIYGDLIGYVKNQERHSEAYKQFFNGTIYHKRNPEKAIEYYEKAIKLRPNFAQAYNNLGTAKIKINPLDSENAIVDYTKAIKLNPKYTEAYINCGSAKMGKNPPDLDGAITDYSEAIKLNTKHADAYFNRGIAKVTLNPPDSDGAITDYSEAIKLDPKHTDAYFSRGNAYSDKHKYDLVIDDYTKAIDLNPNYFKAYINRGFTYGKKGEHDLAIADFGSAIALEPNDATGYNNRGNAYRKKGDYANAIADLKKAIDLNPDFFEAHANLNLAKKELQKIKVAMEDALRLAKEQKNEALADDIQKKIDDLQKEIDKLFADSD